MFNSNTSFSCLSSHPFWLLCNMLMGGPFLETRFWVVNCHFIYIYITYLTMHAWTIKGVKFARVRSGRISIDESTTIKLFLCIEDEKC